MGVTIEIRVRPNASKNRVGGVVGEPARLVVAVTAPAVEGKANTAVMKVLAIAFDVKVRDISIVHGELVRDKRIFIAGDEVAIQRRLSELMGNLF